MLNINKIQFNILYEDTILYNKVSSVIHKLNLHISNKLLKEGKFRLLSNIGFYKELINNYFLKTDKDKIFYELKPKFKVFHDRCILLGATNLYDKNENIFGNYFVIASINPRSLERYNFKYYLTFEEIENNYIFLNRIEKDFE